jgi:diguanylate cyclase (GGDEF)-like protein/PAS domain S-box-containing protein
MSETFEGRSPLILTVDDDVTTRGFLRTSLEGAGLTVIEAASGEEAIRLFAEQRPELVLLDVAMPGLDGFATCAALRAMPGGDAVPIVMLTGSDDLPAIVRSYEVGATDFELKSVKWIVLGQRIHYLLRAKSTLDALRASEARLAAAQRIGKIGDWLWESADARHHWSEQTRRLLGVSPETDATHERFIACVHPDDRSAVREAFDEGIRTGTGFSIEFRVGSPGDERIVHAQGELVRGLDARPAGLAGTVQDVTERHRTEERIRRLAYFDAQTALPNRILFQERVQQAIAEARRSRRLVALLFMDLDHFKQVNDTLGHGAGDLLLGEVASRLNQAVRDTDPLTRGIAEPERSVLARHGGDEFIVCLSGINSAADAARVAGRILAALQAPIRLNGPEVFTTASIGISLYPQDGDDPETLLKHADAAMYQAKASGRNNYHFYDPSMSFRAFQRLSMETSLRRAVERGEFVLHWQPIVDVRTGRTTAAEALIRWFHPDMGLVHPDEFIPLAEETGLVIPIGEWVIGEACRRQREWLSGGHELRVALNISSLQVHAAGLEQVLSKAIEATGADPRRLELEITENAFLRNAQESFETLSRLRSLGLRISIDDFGTGYSSFSYLRRFPVDTLKVDRSLIRGVDQDSGNAAITAAIAAMARGLRVEAVAEGVESDSQRDVLRQQGYLRMQGYLFGKPVPHEEFTATLLTPGVAAPVPDETAA